MLREQVNQTAENKELKNQFVALSDAHRLQQKELDDALHQRDVVQAEKIEQLTRHLTAAQQQVNTERQRSSAEISALQQRIQRLETDGHHQHQYVHVLGNAVNVLSLLLYCLFVQVF